VDETGNTTQAAGEHAVRYATVYETETERHDERFRAAAAVRDGETVLDVGCGTGWAARWAARDAGPDGRAVGVDLSLVALAHARRLAAERGVPNVRFVAADAQRALFAPETFDLVLSSFGTMFFGDPVRAFAGLATALRPGGRLAMIVWQARERNEWTGAVREAVLGPAPADELVDEFRSPFSLGDPDAVHSILRAAGFAAVELEDVHEPVRYGPDPETAYGFVRGLRATNALLDDLAPADRPAAEDRIRAMVAAHAREDGVWFDGRTWVVTAHR
jgi:ubiquinone/menaquinone biosynthesis C-methylase UbiE